jgi:nucleoside-diphosphate-sugar epimerase
MREDRTPNIAVVGAAGFVGRVLLRHLEDLNIPVTAIVRGAPELSVDGDFHAVHSQRTAYAGPRFDIVVNLAYPAAVPGYEYPRYDHEIADTIERLVSDGGRLIQVSTLAVFGAAVDRPISADLVAEVHDSAYVESKVNAELLFMRQQVAHRLSLDIVRLGNVWGYGSGTWAAPIVQKLITGRPIGVEGTTGYSNTTDVTNVASYLGFLVQHGDTGAGIRYHHLAEFSGVRWGEWIDPIAQAIGVEPVLADSSVLDMPASAVQEMAHVLTPIKPRNLYRRLSEERVTGSWTRALVRRLPSPAQARLKSSGAVHAAAPEYSRSEQTFLAIMAGQREFQSVVLAGWEASLSKDESLESVLRWLNRG